MKSRLMVITVSGLLLIATGGLSIAAFVWLGEPMPAAMASKAEAPTGEPHSPRANG